MVSERGRRIMISYKRADRVVADELVAALAQKGLLPWIDHSGILPGMPWRDELLTQLRSCAAFVALLTPAYVASEHCRMELFIARSRGCLVLPIILEECIDLLDQHEETKGLRDIFMARLHDCRVVGLPVTRQDVLDQVIAAAHGMGQEPVRKTVYVAYCPAEAAVATHIARQLEQAGISAWVATQDCRVGEHWRQAQARGLMNAAAQVVVLDETIADADVLRTEILLAEAFGAPVLPVLGANLGADKQAVARVMQRLRGADLTYRRLTDLQQFRSDEASVCDLIARLREILNRASSVARRGDALSSGQ